MSILFTNDSVGVAVISEQLGIGVVTHLYDEGDYPVTVYFATGYTARYTREGYFLLSLCEESLNNHNVVDPRNIILLTEE
jgi:hypothetical protein